MIIGNFLLSIIILLCIQEIQQNRGGLSYLQQQERLSLQVVEVLLALVSLALVAEGFNNLYHEVIM